MTQAVQPKKSPPARLRRRSEFLRAAASGLSRSSRAFKLQMAAREDASDEPRFGVTVTKRVAKAVGRNRIRRRLKEALRLSGALAAAQGYDYVLVARREALTAPFSALEAQMAQTFRRLSSDRTKPLPHQASKKP
ncbi:ribonuclease P protein component [Methylocystis bryophila]|uniref:Ribonuclease P protein component n=1 Tax=Methylocystis bryophila TaxID=655015 RepID=A0A1W6MRU4_9HYPH|nr:ribonuclease P protein component [Methylocystis bryophila]ARN80199.1 ribonuclease P protein component [Methylocystis bryophila]BDV40149.1 ribonuclease P protein component [Methylocystis bryophila]